MNVSNGTLKVGPAVQYKLSNAVFENVLLQKLAKI